jgi:hypothetical protein
MRVGIKEVPENVRAAELLFPGEKQRHETLFADLAAQPIVEIIGIVAPLSGGGVNYAWSDLYSLYLNFDAWRVRGGPLRKETLALKRMCTKKEMIELGRRFEVDTIISVRARLAEKNLMGTPHALLEELGGPVGDDAEMNEFLAELLRPVTHADPVLGTLVFDRGLEHFSGRVLWRGQLVEINLDVSKRELLPQIITIARTLIRDQAEWHDRSREFASKELLSLKNENWLDEGEEELTADDFRKRLTMSSLTLDPDGSFTFWFDDCGLFFGHTVAVSGTLPGGFESADIHG